MFISSRNALAMGGHQTVLGRLESAQIKGMVHLIYKSHLKAVFLCAHYNDAFGFAQNLSGREVGFQLKKISVICQKKVA